MVTARSIISEFRPVLVARKSSTSCELLTVCSKDKLDCWVDVGAPSTRKCKSCVSGPCSFSAQGPMNIPKDLVLAVGFHSGQINSLTNPSERQALMDSFASIRRFFDL